VRDIVAEAPPHAVRARPFQPGLDRWAMHPVWELVILTAIPFADFQAVLAWAH
jgi:hypothetical protein